MFAEWPRGVARVPERSRREALRGSTFVCKRQNHFPHDLALLYGQSKEGFERFTFLMTALIPSIPGFPNV